MNQRASQSASSAQDRYEAYEVGKKAALLVHNNVTNMMVAIGRTGEIDYGYRLTAVPLEQVFAGGERHLPKEYIENPYRYYQWLRPLVGFDLQSFPARIQRRDFCESKTFRS
jgi:6-phosphofructokinase